MTGMLLWEFTMRTVTGNAARVLKSRVALLAAVCFSESGIAGLSC